jgi:LPXTG-motif cell wall-anchored protein
MIEQVSFPVSTAPQTGGISIFGAILIGLLVILAAALLYFIFVYEPSQIKAQTSESA